MSLIINPGTGPVEGATRENAVRNLDVFVEDVDALRSQEGRVGLVKAVYVGDNDRDGRFACKINVNGAEIEVDMPGIPLDQVRFTEAENQNIWNFPRLYVNGSSWVWKYGVSIAAKDPEDDDE